MTLSQERAIIATVRVRLAGVIVQTAGGETPDSCLMSSLRCQSSRSFMFPPTKRSVPARPDQRTSGQTRRSQKSPSNYVMAAVPSLVLEGARRCLLSGSRSNRLRKVADKAVVRGAFSAA